MDETQLRQRLRELEEKVDALSFDPHESHEIDLGEREAWKQTDGQCVGSIYAFVEEGVRTVFVFESSDPNLNRAQAFLSALIPDQPDVEQAQFLAVATGGGPHTATVSAAESGVTYSATVLASTGFSDFVRKVAWTDARGLGQEITVKHWAAATPTGGSSGDIALGDGVIWVNDAGTWKSVAVA